MLDETEKLFYSDAYLKSFGATILSCELINGQGYAAMPNRSDAEYAIVLDRTAFYPEGGGQAADTGRIGDALVKDVRQCDGRILHYTDRAVAAGAPVECVIDWPDRFSRMQQHTGEHIVSGLIKKLLGFDNVGFHMGSEAVTIDFNGVLTAGNLCEIEIAANEAVYQNLPVDISYPGPDELKRLSYRSKKELSGDVRIVTVPGYDSCACCGTHTAATGEIGIIKLVTAQSYKGGTRVAMLCGSEALADYREKNDSVYEISARLSAKPREISAAVEALQNENAELKRWLWQLRDKIFEMKAGQVGEAGKVYLFEDGLSPNELRRFCMLLNKRAGMAAIFSGTEEAGYKYAIGSLEADAGAVAKDLNAALSGRGGGAKGLAQGSVPVTRKEIEGFFAERGWEPVTDRLQ